jgi:hypothetical protein
MATTAAPASALTAGLAGGAAKAGSQSIADATVAAIKLATRTM